MKSAPAKTGAWTAEEDILLVEYQAVYGNKWSQISKHISGRNGQSCAQRWRHRVNPNITREKWTPDEDSLLTKLVQEIGVGKWATVARHLPGRTDQQCMGRWRRHLDPSIRKDAWTAEEDARLHSLYQKHGSSWSMIAKSITNRTPQQCRGRWCILIGSKHKVPLPAAPETSHMEHAPQLLEWQDASTVTTTETARRGRMQHQGCPSTFGGEATTETPAMPASTALPMQARDVLLQPRTVKQAPLTKSRMRASIAAVAETEVSGRGGLSRKDRRPAVLQDPGSAAALMFAEKAKPQQPQPQAGVSCEDDNARANSAGAQRGRLLLGTRVVSFRRRPRSTQRRPRSRLTAVILPSSGGPLNGRASKSGAPASAAAAVALLLSPRQQFSMTTDHVGDKEPAILRPSAAVCDARECHGADHECQGTESCNPIGGANSQACQASEAPGAKVVASTCKRPTVSTSSRSELDSSGGCWRQQPASRTEEAAPGDGMFHMSTRKTRSGRCYPLVTTSAVTSAALSLQHKVANCEAGVEMYTEAPGKTAGATAGYSGVDGPFSTSYALAGGKGQRDRADAAAPRSPDAVAEMVLPDYDLLTAKATDAGLPQTDNLRQQVMPTGSTNTSLGLPGGLFGETAAPPADDQPLYWQEVIGSPPTSSFLAFVEAGLLQTPSGPPGPSQGPDVLCAPVPPGMPKVTPGFSNDWSDVPALSWTELQACHGGFGIIGRQPAASAQGTPDNSLPALRPVQDNCRGEKTPRRDMYVRPAGQDAGPEPTPASMQYTLGLGLHHECDPGSENEGQGDTRSMTPSPSGKKHEVPSGGAADGSTCRQGRAVAATPDLPPLYRTDETNAGNGNGGRTIPDFCSPSKTHRGVAGVPERLSGLTNHLPSAHHGSDFPASNSLTAQLKQLKPVALAANVAASPALSSAPPCLAAVMGGASPHLCLGLRAPIARPKSNETQLPLPPALASALMAGMPQQAHKSSGACLSPIRQRPPLAHQQLPLLAAPGASTEGAHYTPPSGNLGDLVAPAGVVLTETGGALPRLILPKQLVTGTMRSFFPVLSLHAYQTSKENVTR